MARQPIEVGSLTFPTKKAATEYFRAMLHRQPRDVRISEPDAAELRWLLERHPEFDRKVGCGVDYFFVRSPPDFPHQVCFHLTRTDGTSTDFSYKNCIAGTAPTPLSQALDAMRAEVSDDISEAKRNWFAEKGDAEGKVACALTGQRVTINEAHADHAPPRTFNTLALAFLHALKIEPDRTFVTPPADNQYQPRMANKSLIEEWRAYHHKMQVMRIVAKRKNLSTSHESKVKKGDRQLKLG